MRKDILERMKILKQDDIKPNYSELAKQLGCDYRTVKRYYENDIDSNKKGNLSHLY